MFHTCLIADDHMLFGKALRAGIQEIAPQVKFVMKQTAEEALNALDQTIFDLVIADIYLNESSGESGKSVIRKAKNQPHPLICIATSGDTSPALARSVARAGADFFYSENHH